MADVVHITPAETVGSGDAELGEAAEADDPIGGTDGAELATAAADLSAVQADDALLDALGGPDAKVADELGDAELGALLLAWRRDIDSERIPELIDADTAATEIRTASLAKRYAGRGRKRRFMVPVAAAAAVLAIGFTGTALAARDAQPGDTLWGLSKVLYTDHARSVEAAASVRSSMDEARLAIASDRYSEARSALSQAEKDLRDVTATEEAAQLKARHMQLMQRLEGNPDEGAQQPPESSKDGSSPKSTSPDSSSPDSSSPTGSQPQPGPDDPTGTAPTEPEEPTTSEPDDTTTGSPSSETPTPSSETSDDSGRSSDGSDSGSLESPALSGSTN
nr:anti-sigma-D factor RsdA [Prauserella isguenensis]